MGFNWGKAECAGVLNFAKVAKEVCGGKRLRVRLELQNLVITPKYDGKKLISCIIITNPILATIFSYF